MRHESIKSLPKIRVVRDGLDGDRALRVARPADVPAHEPQPPPLAHGALHGVLVRPRLRAPRQLKGVHHVDLKDETDIGPVSGQESDMDTEDSFEAGDPIGP